MGDREQFWRTHVDACRASGDTQKVYCERHGITPKTLRVWQARLTGAAARMITTDGEPHGGEARGGAEEIFSPSSGVSSDRAQAMDLFTNPRVRRSWTLGQRRQIVIDALRSGMSIERFARMSGLTPSVVHRWKQELAVRVGHSPDRLQHPAAAPRFASVHVAHAPSAPAPRAPSTTLDTSARDTVEVILANGRRVRLHARMDAKALHDLLAVLERGA